MPFEFSPLQSSSDPSGPDRMAGQGGAGAFAMIFHRFRSRSIIYSQGQSSLFVLVPSALSAGTAQFQKRRIKPWPYGNRFVPRNVLTK